MRLTLQSIRTLPASLKSWYAREFGEPTSPYTSVNPDFRKDLKEHGTEEQKRGLASWLTERFGFRKGSLNNTLLVLSVVLTSIFVLHDTIADALISADKWGRPLFLPALFYVAASVHSLVLAAKASQDEVEPDPAYSGDEAEQRFKVEYGEGVTVKESNLPGATKPDVANADMTEVSSRAAHDRYIMWLKRFYKNRSLSRAWSAVKWFIAAEAAYAIIGLFV